MFNWNTDEEKLKRDHPREYKLWRLTQLINYGLDGEKLNENELKAAWPKIKDRLDPDKAKAVECLLWQKPWKKERGLAFDRSNFCQWYWHSRSSSKTSI